MSRKTSFEQCKNCAYLKLRDFYYCDHFDMTGKLRKFEDDGFCLSFKQEADVPKKWNGIVLKGSHPRRQ